MCVHCTCYIYGIMRDVYTCTLCGSSSAEPVVLSKAVRTYNARTLYVLDGDHY